MRGGRLERVDCTKITKFESDNFKVCRDIVLQSL